MCSKNNFYDILFKLLFLILIMATLLNGCKSSEESKKSIENNALSSLTDCSYWFIKKGLGNYYTTQDFSEISKYVKGKGAYFTYEGILSYRDNNSYILSIAMNYWPYGSDVTCFERIEHNNTIFEYWVISNESKRTDFDYRIKFLIAKANDLRSERKIIYQSDIFFSMFKLPDGKLLEFPLSKNEAIYDLHPWNHKEAFIGSKLEGIKENEMREKLGWPLIK